MKVKMEERRTFSAISFNKRTNGITSMPSLLHLNKPSHLTKTSPDPSHSFNNEFWGDEYLFS